MTETEFATKIAEYEKEETEFEERLSCNEHQGDKQDEGGENCDVCHHDKFETTETIKKIFGDNVKQCCSGHGYLFIDQCQVRT